MTFMLINPLADIAIYALILSIVSQFIQYNFLGLKKAKQQQAKMKEKQKQLNELIKKGEKEKAEELQKEIMTLMSESIKEMPKQMIVSMALFLPPLYAIMTLYKNSISIPHPGNLDIPLFGTTTGWFEWYLICSIIASLLVSTIFNKIEKV